MSGTPSNILSVFLAARPFLLRRVQRKVGCRSIAEDVLQQVWMRISGDHLASIQHPAAYFRRIADNLVVDHIRRERSRRLDATEVAELLDVADEAPGPEAHALYRDELRALRAALEELPERRRAIFFAARFEGVAYQQIAQRFGIAVRTVELEVSLALDHCARRLGRNRRCQCGRQPLETFQ